MTSIDALINNTRVTGAWTPEALVQEFIVKPEHLPERLVRFCVATRTFDFRLYANSKTQYLDAIRAACEQSGIALDEAVGVGRARYEAWKSSNPAES